MGRRRVKEKNIPMSLSIPYRLIQRLDSELGYRQSRSKWVQGAIRAKLDNDLDWASVSSIRLLVMLRNRDVINDETFRVLKQVVETEE
tara:strand:- start:499 stop:762 length:264 start_codon:yes stop_codon:yes gene_type:complete